MSTTELALANHGRFCIVETEDNVYVGTVRDNGDDTISVLSGQRGRPPVIDVFDVVAVLAPDQAHLVGV